MKIDEKYQMSIGKFLVHVLGINNLKLIKKLSNKSHKDLKRALREYGIDLKSIPYECVEIEDVMSGKIIFVSTKKGELAPYINPNNINLENIYNECVYLEDYKEFTEVREKKREKNYKKFVKKRRDKHDQH